ncbi:MAG: amino acid transport protein [Polyangiaceae bacterium]
MTFDANSLLLSLAIGCVGFVCFAYGKRQGRLPQMAAGAILMIYPYFVPNLLPMAAVGALVLAVMWAAIRFGA